jgi:hypothetical protein
MKSKRPVILAVLFCLAVVIWFINVKFIMNVRQQKDELTIHLNTPGFTIDSTGTSQYIFKPVKRDPFNVIVDTGPKEPVMPQLFLRGVVVTEGGAVALMELSDGNVYPMKQGDTYQGVQIKKITSKTVTITYRGKKHSFPIVQ